MESGDRLRKKATLELQRGADRISWLIVGSDYPAIDIVIAIRELGECCRTHFPDRMDLFEMVYASRFKRLWEQFRQDADGNLPEW